MKELEPRVYVACLACYNAGKHHGDWFDADDRLSSAVSDFFGSDDGGRLDCGGEELIVHDSEGFVPYFLGEVSVSEAETAGTLLREHGLLLACYASHVGGDLEDAARSFQDAYQGEAESEAEFAERLSEEMGDEIPDHIRWHIDWQAVWDRELSMGDFFSVEHEGTYYIYRNV